MRTAVWLGLAGVMSACYRPDLDRCSVVCTDTCPGELTCGADNFCHAAGDTEPCTIVPPDAGPDGGTTSDYLSISVGRNHTCALRQGGLLRCWGDNRLSQLGVVTAEALVGDPQDLPGTWRQVSAGDSHTCAIREDGHLACWGWNDWSQAGVDSTLLDIVTEPTNVDDNTDWIWVSAGRFHTCGIRGTAAAGGAVYCWGADDDGQLGDGTAGVERATPMEIDSGITTWRVVDAGSFHTCASWDAETYCWGRGDHGEVGDPALAQHSSPFPVDGSHVFTSLTSGEFVSCGVEGEAVWCWGEQLDGSYHGDPQQVVTGGYTAVATDYYNTCAIKTTGVRCWGVGDEGQYGNGSWEYQPLFHDVAGLSGITAISAGHNTNCAIDGAGGAWCWGSNSFGQLGVGTVATEFTPVRIGALSGWDRVVAGTDHTCALRDGALWCWGLGGDLQLGVGELDSAVPLQVAQTGWLDVGVGDRHTCGILDVGGERQLWCWGDDTTEQLGNGALGGNRAPAQIGAATDWDSLSTSFGDGGNCGMRAGGARWCWGEQVFGQLGDGSSGGHQATPALINDGPWISVSIGFQFGCGVKSDALYCWGTDLYQQQGRTAGDDAATSPTLTEDTHVWTRASAGYGHACALEAGNVWCWGADTYGQVGNGLTDPVDTPFQVRAASQVSAGYLHTCAIDGTDLWCWGANYDGQLGEPTLGNSVATPQPIAQTQSWASVSAGFTHTCAIEAVTGDLYCWGDGRHGQLGTGAMSSPVPVAVH